VLAGNILVGQIEFLKAICGEVLKFHSYTKLGVCLVNGVIQMLVTAFTD